MNIALILFGSLVCLIMLVYLLIHGSKADKSNRFFIYMCLFNIGMMLSDIPAWAFEGFARPWYPAVLKIGSMINFSCSAPLLLSFAGYILECYPVRAFLHKVLWRTAFILCCVQLLCSILSYWNGMYFYTDIDNIYQRGDWYWLSTLISFIIFAMDIAVIFICRKQIRKMDIFNLLCFILFITLAFAIQIFNYGMSLINAGATISILFIFINIQARRDFRMEQKERELAESRISVMISQIQPHFLYNSLTAIQELCVDAPETAREMISEFSVYLRGNLDSLKYTKPIPFERELKHVETYLSLEKKRFGDKLQIKYDISVRDFLLPSLTLQPVVENAVRHGVTKKSKGGTVTISTRETETVYVITVTDDGVGFDNNAECRMQNAECDGKRSQAKAAEGGGKIISSRSTTERSHIGIENVRNRLVSMCGGALEIQSKPGEGTTAVISIPKGAEKL